MFTSDILLGFLLTAYLFICCLSILAYRASGERRIILSFSVFLILLIKSLYVFIVALSGKTSDACYFLVDIAGILIVVVMWKWKR